VTDCTAMRMPIVRIYLPQRRAFMSPCCRLVLRCRGMTPTLRNRKESSIGRVGRIMEPIARPSKVSTNLIIAGAFRLQ
jgi:hypothetical protein